MRFCLALVAALALAAPAAQAWQIQKLTERAFGYDDGVDLAGNSRGDASLLWEPDARLRIATAHDGGRFVAPRAVPGSKDASNALTAMDESGNTLVAWDYFDNTD